MVGILVQKKMREAGEAFKSTRSNACAINTDYMQICHRHKCTAVRSLTFLFVTSKSAVGPNDKIYPSSLFTCFLHHCTSNKTVCLDVCVPLYLSWPCSPLRQMFIGIM